MTLLAPSTAAIISDNPIARVWRNADYRLFMLGSAPYYTTTWMQRVAIGWLAWELSHSHAWVGAIAAADLGPMIILSPLAGAIVDRTEPVRLMRQAQAVMITQAVLVAALVLTGAMTVGLLFALSIVSGCAQPVYTAARQIIVPSLVPRVDLPSAVSLDASIFHASRFIGPAVAALAIPVIGVGGTCAIHVAGCSYFSWMAGRLPRDTRSRPSSRLHRGLVADIAESVRYIHAHGAFWPLFLMLTVVSVAVRPLQELLPGFAGDVFHAGAGGLAWLTSSMGVGSLAAAVFLALRGGAAGLASVSILAVCGLSIATFGFVATRHLAHAIAFSAMFGFTLTLMGVSIQALVQSTVSDQLRGRVMSLYALLFRGLPALGAVTIGALAEIIGLRAAFALSAGVCWGLWLMVARREREIEEGMRAGE